MKLYDVIKTKDGKIGAIVDVYSPDEFEIELMDGSLLTLTKNEIEAARE